MKTFFTADTHFECPRFYANQRCLRPFSETEWASMMIDTINTMVARNDRLIILGDFAGNRPGYWRSQIRCRHVVLILGNHDSEAKCRNVFGGNLRITWDVKILNTTRVFLSHYPHAYWDKSHHGWLHLYGHCHNQREATLDAIWPERRSMDVSPDTAFAKLGQWRPFSDREIYDILGQRKGHDAVQFYHDYQDSVLRGRKVSTG